MSYYSSLILGESPPPSAYYRLDEISGATAYDSTPNGYDATVTGGTFGQGGAIINDTDTSCLLTNTGTLTVPYTLNYNTWTAISIEFWINLTGTWHYIVATCDGTTTIVYYDGLVSTTSSAATIEISSIFDYAGSYNTANIDEVALYSYVLSPIQITTHFAAATTASMYTAVMQGGVRLLINDVFYPTIRQETINIDRTANDPIPTFKIVLQDDPSQIALSELQEVIFIDAGQISNPTHNLLKNPVINPYTTSWTQTTTSGGTFTQASPGVVIAATNVAVTFGLSQITQNGLIVPGQWYMVSCNVQTSILSQLNACINVTYLNQSGSTIETNPLFIGTTITNSLYSFATQAPSGAVTAQISLGIVPTTSTNSGTATFKNIQFEPMCFQYGNTQMSYPTPFCANGQTNCTLMPDGTTIRQYRLFGGYITKATAGRYIGNNRQWTVTVSGYAWLVQKQILNNTYSNKTDAFIIKDIVSHYFPNQFNVSQVGVGATLDTFGYTYNGTARDAFDALAANSNFYIYIGPYREIIYQAPGYNQLGFLLSDNPDNVTSYPYDSYSLDIDGTQLGNACLVTGATNISAIEYDPQSIGYYNQKTNGQGIFWRTVSDSTIPTTAAARQRAIAEISQYNYARQIVHLTTNQLMVPGYTVLFSSATDDLYEVPFLIQKSTLVLQGFKSLEVPFYQCQCDLGAFNPDMVNITVKLLRKQLTNSNSVGTPVLGLMVTESTTFTDSIQARPNTGTSATYGMGIYGTSVYAFAVPSVPSTLYGTGRYGDATHGYA
jgi:hypothetical protein